MADESISQLTSYGTAHAADLSVIVDTTDTTMAPSGTNKKATLTQLGAALVSTGAISGSGLTSVGLAVPSWLAVAGSPLTSNGTLTDGLGRHGPDGEPGLGRDVGRWPCAWSRPICPMSARRATSILDQLGSDLGRFEPGTWNSTSHILSVSVGGDKSGTDSINIYYQCDAYLPNWPSAQWESMRRRQALPAHRGGLAPVPLSQAGDLIGGISFWPVQRGLASLQQSRGDLWFRLTGVNSRTWAVTPVLDQGRRRLAHRAGRALERGRPHAAIARLWHGQATSGALGLGTANTDYLTPAWTGSSSIATLGTVTSGTWHGEPCRGAVRRDGSANTGFTITIGGNLLVLGGLHVRGHSHRRNRRDLPDDRDLGQHGRDLAGLAGDHDQPDQQPVIVGRVDRDHHARHDQYGHRPGGEHLREHHRQRGIDYRIDHVQPGLGPEYDAAPYAPLASPTFTGTVYAGDHR